MHLIGATGHEHSQRNHMMQKIMGIPKNDLIILSDLDEARTLSQQWLRNGVSRHSLCVLIDARVHGEAR